MSGHLDSILLGLLASAFFTLLWLRLGALDRKIERVEDKADRHYETLNVKIDRQGDKIDRMADNFNNQVTTLLNTIHNVDVRVARIEEQK